MRSATQQKIGSLLGLFAVLLVLFAPLVSQVIRAHDPSLLAQLSFCSEQTDGHFLAVQDESAAIGQAGHAAAGHDGHMPDGAPMNACAYCGFMAAFAALPCAPVPTFVRAEPALFAPLPRELPPLARSLPGHALARAPPLSA